MKNRIFILHSLFHYTHTRLLHTHKTYPCFKNYAKIYVYIARREINPKAYAKKPPLIREEINSKKKERERKKSNPKK